MRKPSFAGSRSFSVLAILLACLLASLPAAAKPRPAVALVHLFLPPDDERSTALMGWVRSLDHARDMLESRRIPTVVSAVPPDDPAELHDLIALKPEVLISTSPLLYPLVRDEAERHPDTVFFACTDEKTEGSMSGYQVRTYEAHYLAGLLAGSLSGGAVGYLANDPYQSEASRTRNANAFTLGAQAANPAIRVLYAPGKTPDDEIKTLIAAGVDIIDMERTRPSLIKLLREHSVRFIGTALRVEDPLFLAAPEWDWGKAFGDLIAQVRFGLWRPRNVSYGIKEGVVRLSAFGPSVPDDLQSRVRDEEKAIRNGQSPFRGPVRDTAGAVRIAERQTLTDAELRSMSWHAQGLEPLPPVVSATPDADNAPDAATPPKNALQPVPASD